MRRSWRVWRRFAGLSVAQLLEYRLNVLFSTLEQVGQLALLAVVYLVIYQYAPVVGGWSRSEALLLLGVAWTFEGTWSFLFARGLNGLSGLVRRASWTSSSSARWRRRSWWPAGEGRAPGESGARSRGCC